MKSDENKTVPYSDERTDDEAGGMNPEVSGAGNFTPQTRRILWAWAERVKRAAPRRLVFLGLSRLAERIPEENLGGVFARGRLVVLRLYFGMQILGLARIPHGEQGRDAKRLGDIKTL